MVFLATFLGFGCLQCLHLALSYRKRASIGYQTKYLVIFFFVLSFTFFCNFFYASGYVRFVPHLAKLGYLLGILSPPLYVLGLWEYYQISWKKKLWFPLFFFPSVFLFLYLVPFLIQSGSEKLLYVERNQNEVLNQESRYLLLYLLISNTYVLLLYFIRVPKSQMIPLPPKEQKVFLAFQIFLVLWHLFGIHLFYLDATRTWEGIFNLGFSIWTIFYSYIRLYSEDNDFRNLEPTPKEQYQKARLKEEKVQTLGKKMEEVFSVTDNLYDSDFSLEQLSTIVGASTHEISQVCRRYFQKSFWELLREKRIQKAMEYLAKTDWPVLRIGLEVGYDSKSAFYKAFQEFTHKTPVEYRKQNQKIL